MGKLCRLLRTEPVLCLFAILAFISFFFAAPAPRQALGYIDFHVLALLWSLMAVSAGLQQAGLLGCLSQRFASRMKNTRSLCLGLTLLCFFSSMLLTNDVALITFVPFSAAVLAMAGQMEMLLPVTVLQTVAANLGSMLTPFGNPQNLYLFSRYELKAGEFLAITAPLCGISLLLVSGLSLARRKTEVRISFPSPAVIHDRRRMAAYLILFAVCLAGVLRLIPWYLPFAVTLPVLLLIDRGILRQLDYGLLASFICFFLFAGNLGNIPAFRQAIVQALDGHERLCGILLSQFISNVPAAVLLCGFTEKAAELIQGVNIGGLGTPVASLASLISLKFYMKARGARPLRYLSVFLAVNLFLLLALYAFAQL